MSEKISDSNRGTFYLAPIGEKEGDFGEIYTATNATSLPFTGESVTYDKQTVTSNTIRPDYQVDGILEVGVNVTGSFDFELRYANFDSALQYLLREGFSNSSDESVLLDQYFDTTIATNISSTATTIVSLATPWGVASGYDEGQKVDVSGFSDDNNNGIFEISLRADATLTLINPPAGKTKTIEAAGNQITVKLITPSLFDMATATATYPASVPTLTNDDGADNFFTAGRGYIAGRTVTLSGMAQATNNGNWVIDTVTSADELVLIDKSPVWVAEAATANVIIKLVLPNQHTATTFDASFPASVATLADSGTNALFTAANGFYVGSWVKISGYTTTDNNGLWRIATIADANTMTFDNAPTGQTWGADATNDEVTILSNYIHNGTVLMSALMVKFFDGMANPQYSYWPGTVFSGGSFTFNAQEIVTGSFEIMAEKADFTQSEDVGTLSAASAQTSMTSSANVGTILVDAASSAGLFIKNITLNIDGATRLRPTVGSKFTQDPGRSKFAVTGSMEVYFVNETFLDLMVAHTSLSLSWRVTDPTGNIIMFSLPNIKLIGGDPKLAGTDEDSALTFEFEADRAGTSTNDHMIAIHTFAA